MLSTGGKRYRPNFRVMTSCLVCLIQAKSQVTPRQVLERQSHLAVPSAREENNPRDSLNPRRWRDFSCISECVQEMRLAETVLRISSGNLISPLKQCEKTRTGRLDRDSRPWWTNYVTMYGVLIFLQRRRNAQLPMFSHTVLFITVTHFCHPCDPLTTVHNRNNTIHKPRFTMF